jgi:general secretion pathway protein A
MLARLSSHRYGQPFAIAADPRAAFESTAFRSAFLALANAIAVRAGLTLLVGDPGCGKTMLLRTLRDAHARGNRPAFLRHATAAGDLLAALLAELGLDAIPADRESRLQALAECLAQRPGPAVLLVDEGDKLSRHQLAELAKLADWRRSELDNLQVVIAGRPEMKDMIERQLRSTGARQCPATTRMGPLLRQEIGRYVAHHLALGRSAVSFDPPALDRLYTHSQGLPLKINLLCICAIRRRTRRIEAADIDAAAQFCGLIPAPANPAAATARQPLPRRRSMLHRAGGKILRLGTRAAGLAGLTALAFAIIHLFLSVEDMARHDNGVQLALAPPHQPDGSERSEQPAPRDYLVAAVKTLVEPGALLAPAILARPLAPRGTELAQGPIVETPAAAPAEPQDSPQDAQEEPAEAAPPAAPITRTDEPPVPLQPGITHLPPAAEGAPQSGTVEPSQVEPAAGAPPSIAIEPVARTPLEPPAPPAAAAPPASPPLPKASTESLDTEQLMRRGHALLQEGDVAAARLFFERAAAGGHAPAFTALGQSYDPLELRRLGVIGIKGDAGRALEWYRAANTAGDATAQQRGARLSGWVEGGQR